MNDRIHKLLLSLLVLALLLRIVFSVFVVGWNAPPRGDEIDYHAIASNLSAGEGFTLAGGAATARRPPAYPTLLGILYMVFGAHVGVGRVFQILLGGFIVYLVFRVAKLFISEMAALVAAILAALNPFLIFISGYLLTENLYIVFMLAFLVVQPWGRGLWGPKKRLAIGAFLLSLLTLTRPTGLFFTCWVFSALVVFNRYPVRERAARAALFLLVWLIPIVPWELRNYRAFGEPVYLTTHGGITFYQGNNAAVRDIPRYYGGVAPLHALPGYSQLERMGELEKNRAAWRLGRQFVRENKRYIPVMTARKFVRFWRLRSDVALSGVRSGWWWNKGSALGKLASSLDVGFIYAVIAIPLFLIGLFCTLREYRAFFFLYGVIAVHTLTALVFFGSIRGRIPVESVVAIFASAGLFEIIRRLRKLRKPASEKD